jgi:hypothetical protein
MNNPDLASFIGGAMSIVNSISKSFAQAKSDLQKGKPFGQVFDETLPKIIEEANCISEKKQTRGSLLRSNSKNMRATFGPFKPAGKNVSTTHRS